MHRMHPLYGLLLARLGLNTVPDMNPPNDEHTVVGLDLSPDFSC